jgi:hypothetical protein
MALQWFSWFQPTDDYRPLTDPPNADVLAWWCTGEASNGDATLVALVAAEDQAEAERAVLIDWPEAANVRFCKPVTGMPNSDRFPLDGWAKERVEAHIARKDTP